MELLVKKLSIRSLFMTFVLVGVYIQLAPPDNQINFITLCPPKHSILKCAIKANIERVSKHSTFDHSQDVAHVTYNLATYLQKNGKMDSYT